MSAENEITALRASGISLLQITASPVLFSMVLCACCFALQFKLAPDFSQRAWWFVREQGAKNPMALLQQGVFNEMFPGYIIYLDRKEGNRVFDVHIYMVDPDTGKLQRDIMADRGKIEVDDAQKRLVLTIYDCTIIAMNPEAPDDPGKVHRILADEVSYPFDYGETLFQKHLVRKEGNMTLAQLFAHVQLARENAEDSTRYYVELHKRAAFALAPFSFVVLAIPFGLQISRRETYAGLVAGVGIAILYFSFMMLFEALNKQPKWHPQLLVWIPNLVCQIVGIATLWRRR